MRRAVSAFATGKVFDLTLLIIICIVAASNWYNPGLPKGHDAIALVVGPAVVGDAITQLPIPEQLTSLGILTGFYLGPPLLAYSVWALSWLFSWVVAAKLLFVLLHVASALSACFFTHELTKSRPAAFVAALAYVFAPYYLIEVVFEGHWSFGAQYMLTPLVFLATEKALQQPRPMRIATAGLALALLICLGHPQTLPILVGPFLGCYMLFRVWSSGKLNIRSNIKVCSLVLLIGLSLTAFWWLPLLREIVYYRAAYSLDASESFRATFLQAMTLRPHLCCAPASAYESSGSALASTVRLLPPILALLGVALNRKNKYVWFFSGATVITWLLAMGSASPVPIFSFVQRHLPLFSGLRTPVRFLLITSFCYAVLTGFCMKSVAEWLGRIRWAEYRRYGPYLVTCLFVSLIIMANTWHETREAFSTVNLPGDRTNSLTFLAERENGDYRIADALFQTSVSDPERGYLMNSTYWVFAHGKETLPGGMPETNKYSTNLIEALLTDLQRGPFDMSQWFSLYNVKYVVIDRTAPLSANVVLDTDFELVWASDNIDIYENHAFKPRLFSVTNSNERSISLYTGTDTNLSYAEGNRQPVLSLSSQHAMSGDLSLISTYLFATPWDYACLEADVTQLAFTENDAIHLVYYSDRDMRDVHLSLDLIESDDSRYDAILGGVDGIKAGWNEVNFPLSLLTLRYSTDENAQLDVDQIDRLWVGVGRQGDSYRSEEFALYFDSLSIVTQETNTNVEYTKIRPGNYKVHVTSDSPTCLVLSEAYHPHWVARVNGKTVHSQLVYQALNGFYLEAGEYDITLEFVSPPLRIAGNVITGVTICILCSLGLFSLVNRWRTKTKARNRPTSLESPSAEC